jgi:nitrate/TMAO reductase-like tetraheme cytochrome c subunit
VGEEAPQPEQPQPPKRRRLRRRWIALIVVVSVLVVLVIAAFVTAHYTSRSSFCDSCHEMEPYYSSWQDSAHASAECTDCHIPPGFIPYVKTKLYSFREIWVHLTGDVKAPLTVTREIPASSCRRCHDLPVDLMLGNASFSHKLHAEQACAVCHVRFVHTDVNPPYQTSPGTMASCLACHDGVRAPTKCSVCHTPGHEPRGECSTCHSTDVWGSDFVHAFPRTGGHAGLSCAACHVSRPGAGLIPGTALTVASPACISCHGDHHGGLTDCARCHSVAGWKPADFSHPQAGPHLSGEHRLSCSSCHPSGYGSATCSKCHSGNPGAGDD